MGLYDRIKNKQEKISVIGLGYVGIPLAIEFAKYVDVIGFDIDEKKVEGYINGIDLTNEVDNEVLRKTTVQFTSDESELKKAKFHIIAVPTPINSDKTPNLNPVISATELLAKNLVKESVVVYESTVYPGTTEEICIPILEKVSGLVCGVDFKVGYSPERINPGDKINTLKNIVKIVSAYDKESLDIISKTYEIIIEAGVYRAESIKVAEAAKVIENSQRDINIAFMNELSMVFNKMEIDTNKVLKAASTKWNFMNFKPGLVGGHCIGVDPYYFIYKAEQLGYHSQIILSGRMINNSMPKHIADNTIKKLIQSDTKIKGAKIAVLGLTFKENCPDIRNTKVIDLINELKEYDIEVYVCDPIANKNDAYKEYNIKIYEFRDLCNIDAIICAVPHEEFMRISLDELINIYGIGKKVFIDVKGMYSRKEAEEKKLIYWSL